MVFVLREGDVYCVPFDVGVHPVGFCPCCGEYSLFSVSSFSVWCLVCSGLSSSFSLSGEELLLYRSRLRVSRDEECDE